MDPTSSARYRYKSHSFDSPYEPQYKYQKSWLPILREIYTDGMDTHTDARLLFDAIKKGKYRLAKFILDASPSDLANSTDLKGKNPLTLCCQIKEQMQRSEMSMLFLEKGTDVNSQDDHGRTTMSYACETKCNDIVDMLIRQNDVDPDLEDHKGNTPLIYSSIVGNDVSTDLLTRNFRRLGLEIDHVNKNGFTALLTAAKHGNISCARILAQQGQASLHVRDKVHGYSVQEWLKLGGYTLEDIVSENKLTQLKFKPKFANSLSITRLSIPNSYNTGNGTSDDDDARGVIERHGGHRDDRRSIHRQSSYREDRGSRRDNRDRRGSHREDRRGSPRDDRRGSQREDRRGSFRQERGNSQREDKRSTFRDERRESLRRLRKQHSTEQERKEMLSREIVDLIESNGNSGESTLIIDPNLQVSNTMLRRKSLMSVIDPTVLKNVIVLPPINKLQIDDSDPSDTDADNTEVDDCEQDVVRRKNFICAGTDLVRDDDDDDDSETVYSKEDNRAPIF